MQFVADLNRLPLRASGLPELSALGAAWSGGLALGVYPSLAALEALPMAGVVYQPAMDPAQVEGLYAGWQHAVRQALA